MVSRWMLNGVRSQKRQYRRKYINVRAFLCQSRSRRAKTVSSVNETVILLQMVDNHVFWRKISSDVWTTSNSGLHGKTGVHAATPCAPVSCACRGRRRSILGQVAVPRRAPLRSPAWPRIRCFAVPSRAAGSWQRPGELLPRGPGRTTRAAWRGRAH